MEYLTTANSMRHTCKNNFETIKSNSMQKESIMKQQTYHSKPIGSKLQSKHRLIKHLEQRQKHTMADGSNSKATRRRVRLLFVLLLAALTTISSLAYVKTQSLSFGNDNSNDAISSDQLGSSSSTNSQRSMNIVRSIAPQTLQTLLMNSEEDVDGNNEAGREGVADFRNETTLEEALASGLAQCSDFRLDRRTKQIYCTRMSIEGDIIAPVAEARTQPTVAINRWQPQRSLASRIRPPKRNAAAAAASAEAAEWPSQRLVVERRSGTGSRILGKSARPSTFRVSADQMKRFLFAQQSMFDPYGHLRTSSSAPFMLSPTLSSVDGIDTDGLQNPRKREQQRARLLDTGDTDGGSSDQRSDPTDLAPTTTTMTYEDDENTMDQHLISETPLECQMRRFTYTATKVDARSGVSCSGLITANICYGGCDTGEISDWLFPHKKSIHKVCRHGTRVRRRALLTDCTGDDVDEGTKDYHYVDARSCVCQKCTSQDTTCLGSLTRPFLPADSTPKSTESPPPPPLTGDAGSRYSMQAR